MFQVEAYMQRLARAYPDKVTLVSGGISFEGRPINYLRISTTNFQVHVLNIGIYNEISLYILTSKCT